MKQRNVVALSLLAAILLGFGFFATPLMRHARGVVWDTWVRGNAKVFGINGIEISDSALETLAATSMENIRLKAELGDYTRLKAQLGSPSFGSLTTIPASIIARPIDTLNSSYVINKGIADGIPNGAPVLVQGSVLIGFTKELSEHSSIVQTVFHPSTSVTVETIPNAEEKVARGLLKSRHQTSLSMETIPRDAPIAVGQKIVTSSNGTGIPYGMILGSVASLVSPEHEAYQSAVIDVPYDSDSINAVRILLVP